MYNLVSNWDLILFGCELSAWTDAAVTYETLVVDGEDFEQIREAFEARASVNKVIIGDAVITCMSQRDIVDSAVQWIENKRQ